MHEDAAAAKVATPKKSPLPRWLLAIFVVLALLAGVGLSAAYLIGVVLPRKMTEAAKEAAAEGLGQVQELVGEIRDELGFTPEVIIDATVISNQSKDILELATAEKSLLVDYEYAVSWLGSTKTIKLRGTYRVKAGFDLAERFTVNIDTADAEGQILPIPSIRMTMPEPALISVEQVDLKIEEDEGWWHGINDEDREKALRGIGLLARNEAEKSGILQEAQLSLERRFKDAVLSHYAAVDFGAGDRLEIRE